MDTELKNNIMKSGTSIVGIICKDGVVMGADRRSTAGNIVVNKNAKKIIPINEYLLVSGTGVASDIDMLQKLLRAELKLKHLKSKKQPSVKEAANLVSMVSYKNIRQFSSIPFIAGTLVAGVNTDGTSEIYTVEPAGTVSKVEDFDANFSSGMPYILGLLERQYDKDISIKDGVKLAEEALKSSTTRDTGSGNGIDIYTVDKNGLKHVVNEEFTSDYKKK